MQFLHIKIFVPHQHFCNKPPHTAQKFSLFPPAAGMLTDMWVLHLIVFAECQERAWCCTRTACATECKKSSSHKGQSTTVHRVMEGLELKNHTGKQTLQVSCFPISPAVLFLPLTLGLAPHICTAAGRCAEDNQCPGKGLGRMLTLC